MAKCLYVFIILLPISVIIAGCAVAEPEPVEPAKSKTPKLEPAPAEPNETAPIEFKPYEVEHEEITLVPAKPNQFEPDRVEPGHVEPDEIKPDEVKPVETEPNDVEPDRIEPNEPELIPTEPNEVEFTSVEPNEPERPEIEPRKIAPAEPEPNNVEPNEPKLSQTVTFHDKCTEVLKNYVDDDGMVDYKTLRRKRLELKALLQEFDNLDPNQYRNWPKEDKIAFWLNAYNIQMLKIITDNYPIKSSRILRLYPGWGPNSILHIKGIWTDNKFLVMDEEFTLSEVDKRFFRKEFNDPRTFFAISNASLSSPPLRNEPYYGHKLNKQLDDQVRRFLSNPIAFKIDKEKSRVYLSSIFQSSSYGKEFLSKFAIDKKFKDQPPATRAVLNFITNYVSDDKVSFLEIGNYSVKFMKYDWTINDGS
jgi:hypothetical protein